MVFDNEAKYCAGRAQRPIIIVWVYVQFHVEIDVFFILVYYLSTIVLSCPNYDVGVVRNFLYER